MECSTRRWIEEEFVDVDFGDRRLDSRCLEIGTRFGRRSQSNVSTSFETWSEIKACYRFFENAKVTPDKILRPHVKRTITRVKDQPRVLILQDTSYFDFSTRKKTKDLDSITRRKVELEASKGLMLHSALAVSEDGLPLGLLNQSFIDRKGFHGENKRQLRYWNNPIEEKESHRWVQVVEDQHNSDFESCQLIHIADREGDIYEFFRDCNDLGEKFVVRAKANRSINKAKRREAPKEKLFDLEFDSDQGSLSIDVQTIGRKKFRKAKLSIIFRDITIPPPPNKTSAKDGDNLVMVPVFAIMAVERKPPKGTEPIKWLLLTNLNTTTVLDAIEKVRWYSTRWNIEIFHKILKSGCSVEKAQFRDAAKLKKYIVFKSIIAWRIFWLTRLGAQDRKASCDKVLTQDEWVVLQRKFRPKSRSKAPPSVSEVLLWIGKLGGFIGRNADHEPGIISIWKGWARFMTMLDDYDHFCG